jgi:hypothetical protein
VRGEGKNLKAMTRLFGLCLLLPLSAAQAQEYCFDGAVQIPGAGSMGPASLYPMTRAISGAPTSIQDVVFRIDGLTHAFPGDLDLLLVGPAGQKMVIQSDAGGELDIANLDYAIRDNSGRNFPIGGVALELLSYRPTSGGIVAGDMFPAPAPAGPYAEPAPAGSATLSSVFGGSDANGVWSLYLVDDANDDGGTLSRWCLSFRDAPLRISEFRLRGPGGASDEYIEVRNLGTTAHTVQSFDGSPGYAVAASSGGIRCVLPNNTVIPPGRNYLCVNPNGYSLGATPAGNGTTAIGDATFTTDIPDTAGVALFRTSTNANFNAGTRLDAAGPTSETNALYREGAGHIPLTGNYSLGFRHAWFRDACGKGGSTSNAGRCDAEGYAIDSEDNSLDLVHVDAQLGGGGVGRQGSAGPENLSAPSFGSGSITPALLDTCVPAHSPPNVVHDTTSDAQNNSFFGTVSTRHTFTNRSGAPITRLRFRIIDVSTSPAFSGVADLRARSSTAVVVTVDRPPCGTGTSNVTVQGTAIEQPDDLFNGGAFNSTLSVGTVTPATPLANNASIDVRFLFGVMGTGRFRATLVPEGLPEGGGLGDMVMIEGCFPVGCAPEVFSDGFE